MKIAPARTDHADAVARLWNGMIRDTLATFTTELKTQAHIAALIDTRKGAFWVAQADDADEAIGFATFGPFRDGPGYAATVEHTIIVASQAHGTGVGQRLMDKAESGADALDKHIMVAAISSANPGAVAFHTKREFVQTGCLPQVGRKAGQWLDLILMQKTISTH